MIFRRRDPPAPPTSTLPSDPRLDVLRGQIARTVNTVSEKLDATIERLRAHLTDTEKESAP